MSVTWHGDAAPPERPRISAVGWARIVLRGVPIALVLAGGLVLSLPVRLIERLLGGQTQPVSPHIARVVCRLVLALIGLRRIVVGKPMQHRGALVANHSSWLDIFALNADQTVCFVAKSEVATWPVIGWLARATGTIFIERNRAHAHQQTHVFRQRLLAGHKLAFFPEGTSTDGLRVLPFKTTLFEAFFEPALRDTMWIQPITISYAAPHGVDPRFYGWWGGMSFGAHMLGLLSLPRNGHVETRYHTPHAVAEFANRKALALASENAVRGGHQPA